MSKAKTLTNNELNKLLNYLHTTKHSERNKLMVYFSFWSGMRVKEIASLKIKDVFNEDGSVKKEINLSSDQTKGNRNRVVFLPSKLIYEIELYKKLISKKDKTFNNIEDPLFTPHNKTTPFSVNSLTVRFKYFYQQSGINNGSSHSGRRTFITNLANKGVSVRVLMELANHSNISTTQKYIDINDEMKKSAIELI